MENKTKEIVIRANSGILFPCKEINEIKGDTLIMGNFNGVCGNITWDGVGSGDWGDDFADANAFQNNLYALLNVLNSGHKLIIVASNDTIKYFRDAIYTSMDCNLLGFDLTHKQKRALLKKIGCLNIDELYEQTYKQYEGKTQNSKEAAKEKIDELVKNKIFSRFEGMKFDTIIQNPPYNKSLHLDFLEKGMDLLTETGKMVIIEPATWLINVRKNGKAKRYDSIKKKLEGHIESIVIENLNKEFGTSMYAPFATTTIDMSKTFNTIDCTICGEHRRIKSIYDCNLVGEYETIWSILEKVQSYGDMMNNHITNEDKGREFWYAKYMEILGSNILGCAMTTGRVGGNYDGESAWQKTSNGTYCAGYISPAYHYYMNDIQDSPHCAYDRGKHLTDKVTDNIYGTKTELENWKHFIFNNKLPLFINIVMTIDQHNWGKEFLPWLVDKQYTDEEINKMFGFTVEEIKLIDVTLKKYERNSPWFKRYMCGKESVTDEEVNNFITEISK